MGLGLGIESYSTEGRMEINAKLGKVLLDLPKADISAKVMLLLHLQCLDNLVQTRCTHVHKVHSECEKKKKKNHTFVCKNLNLARSYSFHCLAQKGCSWLINEGITSSLGMLPLNWKVYDMIMFRSFGVFSCVSLSFCVCVFVFACVLAKLQCPLLLTWFNFNPSMDK